MQKPFYVNMDALEAGYGSKYDVLVLLCFALGMLLAHFVFKTAIDPNISFSARAGLTFGYVGFLAGVYSHLMKQTKPNDEFVQDIFNKAVAQAGLITVIFVCGFTLYQSVFSKNLIGVFAVYAPIIFLAISYKSARTLAVSYKNTSI
ncbi:MAG: hypothetical protein COA43_02180 [Robiginitomaculum sp.]|nr:MAG: hypothetical protein COA43_02180 [Robiginitomaculum sp.]